ncbi:peptidyl-prolyl cis-trans isomerase [Histidinibacterium aquaticum]|uniref:Parvulin-like PPIase n=1 Tax=Histidinibacterium aquaticum TaxID=2613962 RepID=A0A5J5GLU9_9RHOB|nr:peptidyl-prolyl cis-trans isomerase [Histidinibacterium aquaticum]KAA9009130.1 peptidylprolyl isomerase [Histidinibacterium aquaticum]
MAKQAAKKTATWVILGLLFFGLIGFGATNLSGNVSRVGTVGETEITTQEYARELNQQIRALEQQTGQALPFAQAVQMGIDRAVLQRLVGTHVLDNEAAEMGLSAGDERVAEEIQAIPQFGGTSGFDRQAYAFALDRAGMTEAEFEAGLRDELARTLLQGAVVAAIPEPQAYADAVAAFLGETRSFLWAELTEEDLAEPLPEPTEEQLQSFYEENTDRFQRPERREITYAALTPDMIVDEVEVDEEALEELYQERIDDYVRPERRLVERLVFEDDSAAQQALDRLEEGELDFDTLVTERGLNLANIDLGDVTEDDLGEAGADVFAAETGDVVGPLPSEFGPALFRVNAVLPAQETTFEEARTDLREELAAERARRVIESEEAGMTDLLAGGATVEDLAEQTALELGTISYDAETTEGIAAYAAFRQAAENTAPEDFPEITALEDGGVFALRVDAIRPPEAIPFDETRDAVAEAWRQAELKGRLMARAEELATEVEEAGDFTADMPAANTETGLDRRGFVPNTPPAFLTEVFEMEEGEARVVETGAGAIVVLLTGVSEADPEDETLSEEAQRLAQQAQAGITQDIFDIYTGSLQMRTDVQIDQQAVNAVNSTFR